MKKNVTHFLKSALLSVCAVVSLLLAGTQSGYAQPGAMMQLQEVKGVVVDQQGNPVIGATVELKDSFGAVAVATDLEGRFTLNAPKSGILVFSYVGYMTHEVEIAGRTNITVSMVEDAQTLEDVVVVGYGVQKRSSLTGSISQVKAEDMEARTITTASQALQGKTSGVQVLSGSARPGASPSIRIRGIGSNSSTEPLYVVDGRIASGIAGIDPNDIESMEVLKDGASAAIYGAQAGNGVILITTKKGKGSGRITYDYQRTVQSLAYVPQVMNSEQYIDYYTEAGAWTLADFYNNWDFNAAGEAFEIMTGKNIYDAFGEDIAGPINMQDWSRESQKKTGDLTVSRFPAYHFHFSTRDMARIGYLMLRNGKWEDKQVISPEWIKKTTSVVSTYDEVKSKERFSYGYMWWLFDESAPKFQPNYKGAYTAWGAMGQYITVIPELDMVVAFKTDRLYGRKTTPESYFEILDMIISAQL